MNLMLDVLGHPEESFRVIHVTGTNGKGSTARMAEAICRAYGMRTGLYTSPHLERINERIAIDGQSLSDDDFVDTWDQVKLLVDLVDMKMEQAGKPRMSFFEVLTAMAIWKFADAPVDVAVVEVGMGGAWDATNVLNADAAVIGPVDMDHMQWLGDTVEQIGRREGRHHQARLHRRDRTAAARAGRDADPGGGGRTQPRQDAARRVRDGGRLARPGRRRAAGHVAHPAGGVRGDPRSPSSASIRRTTRWPRSPPPRR